MTISSNIRNERWLEDAALHPQGAATEANDCVEVASEDSFPASDAPSWTVVMGTGAPPRPGSAARDLR